MSRRIRPPLKAGIKIGDAIVRLDGETVKDPSDLARRVARISPGKPAKVTVMRDGSERQMELTIGSMPTDQKEANAKPDTEETAPAKPKLGLTLEKSSDGHGVVIAAVEPESPAASKGFRAGDVVLKVGNVDVNDPDGTGGGHRAGLQGRAQERAVACPFRRASAVRRPADRQRLRHRVVTGCGLPAHPHPVARAGHMRNGPTPGSPNPDHSGLVNPRGHLCGQQAVGLRPLASAYCLMPTGLLRLLPCAFW